MLANSRSHRYWSWVSRGAGHGLTVLAMVVVAVALPRLMPGDPWSALWTQGTASYVSDDEQRVALQAQFGLDAPLGVQIGHDVARLLMGDFGMSIQYRVPVWGLVGERVARTLLLVVCAMIVGVGLGRTTGAWAGWRHGSWVDRLGLLSVAVVRATPVFFIATLALHFCAVKYGWFPVSGFASPFVEPGLTAAYVADIAHHLALPLAALVLPIASGQFLIARASLMSQRSQRYLLGAIARGATNRHLFKGHALRAAAAPMVTFTGVQLSMVVGGAVVVETVFAYPGVGRLLTESIAFRDYPVMQVCFVVVAIIVVTSNAIADIVVRTIDPRVSETA